MGTQDKEQEAIYDDASSSCSLTPSQQADEDDDIREDLGGCLSRQPLRALQSRASFLNGRPSILLYFWDVADVHHFYNLRYNVSTKRQGLCMHLVLPFQAGVLQQATTAVAVEVDAANSKMITTLQLDPH